MEQSLFDALVNLREAQKDYLAFKAWGFDEPDYKKQCEELGKKSCISSSRCRCSN